ncbi:hypothetical protein RKLH11_513 [Rhodobacteraceae bacterium KLH11]|nr:hypothetical protein RKLH11_513 [Rhodobacteraceae bacterium KLH11]
MPDQTALFVRPATVTRKVTLDQRIEELRARKPADLNHGEALLLQGMAMASLRKQCIAQDKIDLS